MTPLEDEGPGWRPTLMQMLWAVLLLVVGWVATDATSARVKMADDIATAAQRIAILEESNRNMRDSLTRIESVLEDIRRDMRNTDRRR